MNTVTFNLVLNIHFPIDFKDTKNINFFAIKQQNRFYEKWKSTCSCSCPTFCNKLCWVIQSGNLRKNLNWFETGTVYSELSLFLSIHFSSCCCAYTIIWLTFQQHTFFPTHIFCHSKLNNRCRITKPVFLFWNCALKLNSNQTILNTRGLRHWI